MKKEIQDTENSALAQGEYKASWLELFFDLVFVALVAQLTYQFSYHHSGWEEILQFTILGYMMYVAWLSTTANRNLRQQEDIIDVLAVQVQMVLIMVMSLALPQAFGDYSVLFFGAMAINGFINSFLSRRLYALYPERRPDSLNLWWGFFWANCLWGLAGILAAPFLYVIAGTALLLSVFAPLTKGSQGKENKKILLNMHHLLERFGLFLLLVMGEAVLVVALANSVAGEFDIPRLVIVICGLLQMIGLWWLYFPYITRSIKDKRARWFQIMMNGHGLLYGSLILIAAGLKNILHHPESGLAEMTIFLIGICGMVMMFNLIRASLTHTVHQAVISLLAFLAPLTVLLSMAQWLSWTAFMIVPAATAVLLLYVYCDYRVQYFDTKI